MVSLHSKKSGLRLHQFSKNFVYLSYLKVKEIEPKYGSEKGQIWLTIKVD
jgi:hypothetical protein